PLPHAAVPIGLAGSLDPQQELRVLAPPAGLAELLAGGVAPVDALLALAVAARVDHERRREPGLGAQLLGHGLGIRAVGLGARVVRDVEREAVRVLEPRRLEALSHGLRLHPGGVAGIE